MEAESPKNHFPERIKKYKNEILLLSAIIVASLLSLILFIGQSIRFDEAQTLWASTNNISSVLQFAAQRFDAPLYLIILYGWATLFGLDIVFARLLSLIFFIFGIIAIYYLGKLVYDKNHGSFAALLFAISPFMIWYGNEARMYSLLTLIVIVNQYFFIKIAKKQYSGSWLGYGLTLLLGVYTHYFFFLNILCQLLFVLFFRVYFNKQTTTKIFFAVIFTAILFTPWFIYMAKVGNIHAITANELPTSVTVFNTFSNFLFGFQQDHLNTIIISFWPLTILLGFLSLRKNQIPSSITLLFLLTIIIPIIGIFFISYFWAPLFISRYLILTLPALYLFLSSILFSYPKPLSQILRTVLVVIIGTFLLFEATSASVPVKENYLQVSKYLEQNAGSSDVIALSTPYTIFPFTYYYGGKTVVITIPQWDIARNPKPDDFLEADLSTQANSLKKQYQRIWLVLSQDGGYQERVRLYFDKNFEKIYERSFSPNINLFLYKLQY